MQFQAHRVLKAMRTLLLKFCQWNIGKTKRLGLFWDFHGWGIILSL